MRINTPNAEHTENSQNSDWPHLKHGSTFSAITWRYDFFNFVNAFSLRV